MIRPEDWRPADGLTLEPNALRVATERQRCIALTAGPGAGKTEVLAQRADFLLRTGTCRYPKRILAISFKVDASRNLKERVRRRCGPELSARFDSYTFQAFAKRIIDRFRPVLTGRDALDPDYAIGTRRISRRQIELGDLLPLAIQILKSSPVARNAIRQTYTDVFLDEFQDCTKQQYALVKLAFQECAVIRPAFYVTAIRLTAVGDSKQRIMVFAGALEGIFSTFAVDFEAIRLNLYLNFRSKARLLRMQNEIIRVLDPASVMPSEQIIGHDGEISTWDFETSQDEAEKVAEKIEFWLRDEGIPHPEIAVLVSKQPHLYAGLLMAELERRGIPYRNEQQFQDLTSEPIARLIVDYLLVLFGLKEPAAWLRLMNVLLPFAEDGSTGEIRQNWQRIIQAERKKAVPFAPIGIDFHAQWAFVLEFLGKVGSSSLASLSPDYESTARLEALIQDVRAHIEDQLRIEPDLVKALARFSDDRAIRILTVHKSKGLEFDTVVFLGVEKETFWGKEDDERCAFFVGVSRTKRRLVLTVSRNRPRPPSWSKPWYEARSVHEEFMGYAERANEAALDPYLDRMDEEDDRTVCTLCDPGEDRMPAMVNYTSGEDFDEGRCDWCGGVSVRCRDCGASTGIDEIVYDSPVECAGGCGQYFRVDTGYDDGLSRVVTLCDPEEEEDGDEEED